MNVSTAVGIAVGVVTLVGAGVGVVKAVPTRDEIKKEIETVRVSQATKHDFDWIENRLAIVLTEIRYLERKQEAVGLTESEQWQLQDLRQQVQEFRQSREQVRSKLNKGY